MYIFIMSMIFTLIEIQFDIKLNNNDELLIIIWEHNKKGKSSSVVCNNVEPMYDIQVKKCGYNISDIILTSIIFHLFNDHILGCSPHCTSFFFKKKPSIITLLHCTPRPCPYTLYRFRVQGLGFKISISFAGTQVQEYGTIVCSK